MEEQQAPHQIELKSEEVNEILSQVPHSLVRWGSTAIFFVICVIIASSYFIKFSETNQGTLILTSKNPPINLVNNTQGKLLYILPNKSLVHKDQIIAGIENTANLYDIKQFDSVFKAFDVQSIQLNSMQFDKRWNLGELQSDFINFIISLEEFEKFKQNSLEFKSISHLRKQIGNINKLKSMLEMQNVKIIRELDILKANLDKDKTLYERGIISKRELDASEANYLRKFSDMDNISLTSQNHTTKIQELEKQITDLEISFSDKNSNKLSAISTTYNNLAQKYEKWKQSYFITAPFEGKINYLLPLSEGQFVSNQTELFSIISATDSSNELVGKVLVNATGMGKIALGQTVNIHLHNFPDKEFGILKGEVRSIADIPNKENKYEVEVVLKNGLKTTYNKTLTFSQKMTGTADIVTKEKRIISKIFENILNLIENR